MDIHKARCQYASILKVRVYYCISFGTHAVDIHKARCQYASILKVRQCIIVYHLERTLWIFIKPAVNMPLFSKSVSVLLYIIWNARCGYS